MESLKKLPIGVQSFEKLRREGYLYVDKTRAIHNLVDSGNCYFLSRPRRFGKSLLISTLEAYFLGKKDLFEGLWIADVEKEWTGYPVLRLDLNTQNYSAPESLEFVLDAFLKNQEKVYEIDSISGNFGPRFENIIKTACEKTGRQVVILVDEYDKPLLEAIGNPDLQDAYRRTLKGFYGALKSMDEYIKFALLTGVTKFGKVSVFSDLNNLKDITLSPRYYDICGITEDELISDFKSYIQNLAEANGLSESECMEKLRKMYDGYHFAENVPGMYNPFSLLNTFSDCKFGSYWFETGTPTYLVELIKQNNYQLQDLETVQTNAAALSSIDSSSNDPIPVIYQSGYLTIQGYDPEYELYTLGYPNEEVRKGFLQFLLPYYSGLSAVRSPFVISEFCRDVRAGNTEQFINRLKSFIADTPYELVKNLENHYQNQMYVLCRLMGLYTRAEYHTSSGRIDMVIQTDKFCYVIEFKFEKPARKAMQQIEDKEYELPFAMNGQKIVRIGMTFSRRTRNIAKVVIK